jgi:hypothetical protein
MITYGQIRAIFDRTQKVVEVWNVASEPNVKWHGSLRKCLSQDVYNALEELTGVAGRPNAEFNESARSLVMFIDKLAIEWIAFTDQSRAGAMVDPAGSPALWSAYSAVRDNLELPKFKLPEPIEQLIRRENVPAWQVAKVYGWGEDVAKVQEELENPGTHYDPKTWVHPETVRLLREIDDNWAKRVPVDLPVVDLPSSEPAAAKIAPESLETLIQQRVPVGQIAKMKGIAIEDVEQAASNMGIALAGARFVRPGVAPAIIQEQLANDAEREKAYEREQNSKVAPTESKEEKIAKAKAVKRFKELRTSGLSPVEIQEKMRSEYPSLDLSAIEQ